MTVKELRDSRKNVSSIYIEFNEIKTRKPLAFISFFEGYDAPYYMPYIKIVTLLDVEQIICGSKQRVIEVHDKFRKKGVLKDCYTGFFVDRDFDFNSDLNPSTDFYVTRGYSVENYYCEKAAFEDILRNHFHYNCIDADYDLIVNNYLTLQALYNQVVLHFNAWYCRYKRMGLPHVKLNQSMPNGYISVDLANYKIFKHYSRSDINNNYPCGTIIRDCEIEVNKKWMQLDLVMNIRGKYEFWFLVEFLKDLARRLNNWEKGEIYSHHPVSFNMSCKDALSSLAQYAVHDEELRQYLHNRIK